MLYILAVRSSGLIWLEELWSMVDRVDFCFFIFKKNRGGRFFLFEMNDVCTLDCGRCERPLLRA